MSDLISSDLDSDMKNSWRTDPRVFNAINKEFDFSLDGAASHANTKVANNYLTIDDDALAVDWSKVELNYKGSGEFVKTAWINPPYSRGMIKKFMNKCIEQKEKGVTSVLLVPATLDAQWLPISDISEIRIITGGRLTFIHPESGKPVAGNTKGSMFVIFRPSKMPCTVRLIDRDELLEAGT
ncbi:MAG: phage N-6-adenine-methyltransferase [Enterobacterales bacterium]|jgi:phage N-6-adenine-methyltransferase